MGNDPGVAFEYSNSSAHLVAAVLQNAVDEPVLDYARAKLFDPLGIDTRPAWHGLDTDRQPAGSTSQALPGQPTRRVSMSAGSASN